MSNTLSKLSICLVVVLLLIILGVYFMQEKGDAEQGIFAPPQEVKGISRFWQPETYRKNYTEYLINDIRNALSEGKKSKYVPELGSRYDFDKGNIVLIHNVDGELRIRYTSTKGPFRTYSFTDDEWGYSE